MPQPGPIHLLLKQNYLLIFFDKLYSPIGNQPSASDRKIDQSSPVSICAFQLVQSPELYSNYTWSAQRVMKSKHNPTRGASLYRPCDKDKKGAFQLNRE